MNAHLVAQLVAGVIAPLLTSALKRPSWQRQARFLTALLTSLGLGTAAQALSGNFTSSQVANSILAVFALSTTVYHAVLKGGKLDTLLTNLGHKAPVVLPVAPVEAATPMVSSAPVADVVEQATPVLATPAPDGKGV